MRYLLAVTLLLFASAAHAEKGEVESLLYDYLYKGELGYLDGYAMGAAKGILAENDMFINSESSCTPEGVGPRDVIKVTYEYIRDLRLSNDPADQQWLKDVEYISLTYDIMKIATLSEWGSVRAGNCRLYDQYKEAQGYAPHTK